MAELQGPKAGVGEMAGGARGGNGLQQGGAEEEQKQR